MRYIDGEAIRQGGILLPTDVERELVEIVEQLEKGAALVVREATRRADLSLRYDLAYARALLKADGAADVRKARAMLVCEELYSELALTDARLRMCRDSQHDLRAMLEAVRSIGASVRSSMWEGQGSGGSASGQAQSRR